MPNRSLRLPLFLLLCLPACRPTAGAQAVPGTQPVDTSYYVTLGGVRQYVEIRGASSDLPVLLYLHGGPCMPATPMLRYHQAELSESFVVVSWDQRGCGRSAEIDPRPGDMTLERHVLDAHQLTTHLKDALRKQRIFLVGHSWGSVLGVELAQRYPDDYVAYVGIGQMVNVREGERLARDTLVSRARARGDTTTVRAVETNGYSTQEGYADGLQGFLVHRRLLWMNGMMDHDPNAMLQAIAAADGYSTDVTEWMQAALYVQGSLFRELMAVDFTLRTAFEIPVFFFAGRHDFNTPSQLVAEYAEQVDAPAKRVIWFEGSGHSPPWEEPEVFRARLAEVYEVVVGLGEGAELPDFEFLDLQVEALMEEWSVPGLSVAVVVDGDVQVLRGYGLREVGRPENVDEHTIFALASATKAFTAAAIGILVDERLLQWDDLVATHLPGMSIRDPQVAAGLTIRDLLSHQSGYDRHDALWHAFGYTRKEIVDRLGRLERSWGLRERFGYQSLMYIMAGEIIESVSGLTWDRFIEDRILQPLGMERSAPGTAELERLENVATPHVRNREGVVVAVRWRDAGNIGPAGSMISSAADMAEWLKLQLAQGSAGGRRILAPGTVLETHTPQVRIRPEDDIIVDLLTPGGKGVSYGLGWYVHEYGGHTVIEHPGGIEGMSPMVTLVPELGAGIVILANISMPTGAQFALRGEILDELLGIPGLDWPAQTRDALQRLGDKYTRARGSSAARGAEPLAPTLQPPSYAGSYYHDAYGEIQIVSGDRGLAIRFGPRGTVSPLIHLNGDEFLLVWQSPLFPPERCSFELDEASRVRAVVLTGLGRFRRATTP